MLFFLFIIFFINQETRLNLNFNIYFKPWFSILNSQKFGFILFT